MICIGIKGLGLGGVALPDIDTTIESALYRILTEDASVYDSVDGRIYPNMVPQNVDMPAITYQQVSGPRLNTADGPTGISYCNFQVNCWSDEYGETRQIAEVVRKCLDGYSGTVNSRVIHSITIQNEGDNPQLSAESEELLRYGKYLDFIVWFNEPTS